MGGNDPHLQRELAGCFLGFGMLRSGGGLNGAFGQAEQLNRNGDQHDEIQVVGIVPAVHSQHTADSGEEDAADVHHGHADSQNTAALVVVGNRFAQCNGQQGVGGTLADTNQTGGGHQNPNGCRTAQEQEDHAIQEQTALSQKHQVLCRNFLVQNAYAEGIRSAHQGGHGQNLRDGGGCDVGIRLHDVGNDAHGHVGRYCRHAESEDTYHLFLVDTGHGKSLLYIWQNAKLGSPSNPDELHAFSLAFFDKM